MVRADQISLNGSLLVRYFAWHTSDFMFYFYIILQGESRTLKQFQYKDWPEDKKVPLSISSILEIHEMVYKNCDAHSPVIVHCL